LPGERFSTPPPSAQHVAYTIPVAKLDKVISEFADKGSPVISRFDTPWAEIVFLIPIKRLAL